MVVDIIVKFKAGGVVMPIYRGERKFSMNADANDDSETILDIARQRAMRIVKQDGLENAPVVIESVEFA